MSKSTKTTLVIAIIIFLSSLVVFGLMVFQVNNQGEQLSKQIVTLEAERAQEDSFFRLQKIADDSAADRERLQEYFLASESNSIDFLNLVESLAPRSGVELQTNSLSVAKDEETGREWIEVSFTFSSSRMRIENFLEILENLPYVLRIQDFSMSKIPGGEWEAGVNMRVQILNHDR